MKKRKKKEQRWVKKRHKKQQEQRLDFCFRNIFVKSGIVKGNKQQ